MSLQPERSPLPVEELRYHADSTAATITMKLKISTVASVYCIRARRSFPNVPQSSWAKLEQNSNRASGRADQQALGQLFLISFLRLPPGPRRMATSFSSCRPARTRVLDSFRQAIISMRPPHPSDQQRLFCVGHYVSISGRRAPLRHRFGPGFACGSLLLAIALTSLTARPPTLVLDRAMIHLL